MKLIKNIPFLIALLLLSTACSKDKSVDSSTNVGYQEQYNQDILKIETYLKTHAVVVVNNPGFANDQDATFSTVPNLDPSSIWGSDAVTPKTNLLFKNATFAGVVHKIYFLKFRQGIGTTPTLNNQITTYYKGFLLNDSVFDMSNANGATFPLNGLILGWQEIFPEFKSGITGAGNQMEEFGAGAMFLPSAYAYYNLGSGNGVIPPYTPIAFNFKLFKVL
jgi:hypothetical protein